SDSAGPFTFAAPGITKSAWRKALRTNLQGHLKLRRMLMSFVYWSFIENRIIDYRIYLFLDGHALIN
ncbi:MAG: hypothetical protein P8X55_12315, partial [Desulfosarcinaceae bacterium]